MRPVQHVVTVQCKASRQDVWRFLADSPLQNQFIASNPLETKAIDDSASSARFVTETSMVGVSLRYREEPFEWETGRFFSWHRMMESGPALTVSGHYAFEDAPDGGSSITVRLTTVPRYFFAWPIAWIIQGSRARRLARFIETIDGSVQRGEELAIVLSEPNAARALSSAAPLKKKHDPALVEKLVQLILEAGDLEVLRMRPFELARTWEAQRGPVLRLLLDAVGVGLVELHWAVLCPSCRTVASRIPSLAELSEGGHCHVCDIRFDLDINRMVEATFAPHPSVRPLEPRPFCIGGPLLTPHVVSQAIVRPPETVRLRVPDEGGRYRLFARGGSSSVVDATEGAPDEVTAQLETTSDGLAIVPAQIDVAPGGTILVSSAKKEDLHVKLERMGWDFDAATALHVSALPEFRAQYGSQALRPGLSLKVGHVAILFSDLVGSTALYSEVGDAGAFGIVTDCLGFGRTIVENHGGVVIKTMGDAVMGAFTDAGAGFAAGAAMVEEWAKFAEAHAGVSKLDIKVGLWAGPCTVVTANGVLDYFGQTVNTAARVQHLAGARELVVPATMYEAIPSPRLRLIEPFEATVKGIPEALSLVRLGL